MQTLVAAAVVAVSAVMTSRATIRETPNVRTRRIDCMTLSSFARTAHGLLRRRPRACLDIHERNSGPNNLIHIVVSGMMVVNQVGPHLVACPAMALGRRRRIFGHAGVGESFSFVG